MRAGAGAGWRAVLARGAYSALMRLLLPAWFARLWWRGRHEPAYREAWAERLGGGPAEAPGRLWLHAVSLGETRAAAPLVDELRRRRPGLRLLLTHGTATGREAAGALRRDGDALSWLPLDTPGAVRRFLRRHRPCGGVVMETEVWPNLLHAAGTAGVPLVLASARLSPKSFAQGQRLAALLHPALARFDAVLAQTDDDAARLRRCGARAVEVTGNLKFDLAPSTALQARGARWRAALARPVVLGAVTREGEEVPLLRAWAQRVQAAGAGPRADAVAGALAHTAPLLVLVPRHPQRFDEVARQAAEAGFAVHRRSGWGDEPPAAAAGADVWIGDSLGEMALYYALADVALLGGSFAPLGGQNLIEAAACGCPLVMGPHTFNFAQAAADSAAAGAAQRVDDLPAAVDAAWALLHDDPRRAAMARAGTAFAAAHRGAAARTAQAVLALIDAPRR